ncbi:hypothetical protein VNI00_015151 [Paramarasmius palmivorus]|uniref:DUF6589 domain-containing protein n=1 Tax=Paramarasmius palmivorus TaxID=297713 RepID=A0AAW0BM90_9AGAR
MTAGWQAKKATPWHQSHDLISISLPAHILDGFRIYCEADDFSKWAKSATMEQFDAVALRVFNNLFTSAAYHQVRKKVDVDTVLCNNILYNQDALLYWLLVKSIKAGNISCVVLVLRVWMVMMRTPKTMPCYADAIFETLEHLEQYPETVRKFFLHNWLVNLTGKPNGFKEVDLLQEHQNFWLKPVRDFLHEGSKAVNQCSAFSRYRPDDREWEQKGFQGDPEATADIGEEADDSQEEEPGDYEATAEDLADDDEEPIEMADTLIAVAVSIIDNQ